MKFISILFSFAVSLFAVYLVSLAFFTPSQEPPAYVNAFGIIANLAAVLSLVYGLFRFMDGSEIGSLSADQRHKIRHFTKGEYQSVVRLVKKIQRVGPLTLAQAQFVLEMSRAEATRVLERAETGELIEWEQKGKKRLIALVV